MFKAKTHNIATIVAFYLRNHFGDYKILCIKSGLTWAKSSQKKFSQYKSLGQILLISLRSVC
jgi:hypothetical protein